MMRLAPFNHKLISGAEVLKTEAQASTLNSYRPCRPYNNKTKTKTLHPYCCIYGTVQRGASPNSVTGVYQTASSLGL